MNEDFGIQIKEKMYGDRLIDTIAYAQSNHGMFKCTDCHSPEYETFPHAGNLRMEMMYACNDCHGGDPEYAKFHFDEIEEAFYESMHYNRAPDAFNCWSCHNPHTYKTQARVGEKISETVTYDNQICLKCHADVSQYELLTERENINIIKSHEWLPNQELHFKNVRCIECHTQLNDSLLVSHVVMPKDSAIRECTQCHSENSHLMASLYKYKSMESRKSVGFLNAVIINDSYVIGANRNKYLNILSVVLFGLVLFGIFIHALFRIIKRK
ncbi:cytochrome c3 family protein [Labilibaculum sp. DW002]|uniref:Cytochrome c3 family protein n=1 Tax=Paralabilibaculum antarcticum TaxID=2912572 RepID=A0ABT5VP34_9BACT|nr:MULTISPECIES: cytochrome c3 family protein [unclassified Labilibaculum]MBI9059422.1 cytochrome c3 family protein [Labilibaculum sp.]MDE5416517.1 cytochrome c3 family protein [Labilibaculum sp. DW002]